MTNSVNAEPRLGQPDEVDRQSRLSPQFLFHHLVFKQGQGGKVVFLYVDKYCDEAFWNGNAANRKKRGIPLEWDQKEKKKNYLITKIHFSSKIERMKWGTVLSISFHLQNYSKLLVCQELCINGLKTNFQGCLANFSHRVGCYFEHWMA